MEQISSPPDKFFKESLDHVGLRSQPQIFDPDF